MRIATLANAAVGHTRSWVERWRSRGHDVRLWSLESGPEDLRAEKLPAAPLPRFLRYPLAAPTLRRALDRYQPDLVDAHFVPNYGLLGVLGGWRPLSVTAWGSDLLLAGRGDPFRRARARFVMEHADLVLADAENLAQAARDLGAPIGRVHRVPWGVDLACFRPAGTREAGLLISTRMHEPIYDVETLLAGVAPIMARRPHTHLVIAGDGSGRAELERRAARLLPAGRYRFVGLLEPQALAAWLARAEVYLSASRSDSTSVSLLEAMAAGAVPVVSDIEGNREWVGEADGARLFAPGDPAALERAVEALLDEPDSMRAARERNRRVVEERGDSARNLARIEGLFTALAARPRSAGRGAR